MAWIAVIEVQAGCLRRRCGGRGQALLIRLPRRAVRACQSSQLGSPDQQQGQRAQVTVTEQRESQLRRASGAAAWPLGDAKVSARRPLADGFCLLCRLDGRCL